MRNPLKRLARRDHPRKPLRERLDAAKARLSEARVKARQLVAVNRALLKPASLPVPAVDRAALVNYATWLYLERSHVCAELYPHMGRKAGRFVLSMNEAWRFFHDGADSIFPRKDMPPASTRAVKILDLVGVDWRKDRDAGGAAPDGDAGMRDTGERPAVPHGWPAPDAALLDALDDLLRLDAAIDAMLRTGDARRDGETVPGLVDLERARNNVLDRLARERAEGLAGLQAKGKALLTQGVSEAYEDTGAIAQSLARDLLGAHPRILAPLPDPIFAAIEETRRLDAVYQAMFDEWQHNSSEPAELIERRNAACNAMWKHVRGTLLVMTPTTAEGCKALARFAREFWTAQGSAWDDDAPAILALIARSPLL